MANADRLAAAGEYKRALLQLEPVLAEYPEHDALLCGLGRLFSSAGEYRDASASFDQVLARNPNNVEAREGATSAAMARRDYAAAKKLLDDGLKRQPSHPRMHLMAARFALAQGDDAAAMRSLTHARALASSAGRTPARRRTPRSKTTTMPASRFRAHRSSCSAPTPW